MNDKVIRPLDGLVVVSIEQAVAAPMATRHLADLGARVIKIERADGGDFARHYDESFGPGMSSWFVWLNRGKQSVVLDLKQGEGRETLRRLVCHADVFVQNLAPGAAERLGFTPEALRASNPKLVTCSITGYGTEGPYRDRKAYDLLIQAETGLISLTGSPTAQAKVGISVADIAGAMYAYSGVLAALLQRGTTGRGSHVEVSLFDAVLEWLGHQITITQMLRQTPPRAGAAHATIAPYRPYRCKDGREIVVAVQNTREWRRLCDALDTNELASDQRFVTNTGRVGAAEQLDDALGRRIAELSSDDLISRLAVAGLAWARINDMPAVLNHEQLAGRHRRVAVDTPGGPYQALRSPIDIDGIAPVVGSVPDLGEHTEQVLAWLRALDS